MPREIIRNEYFLNMFFGHDAEAYNAAKERRDKALAAEAKKAKQREQSRARRRRITRTAGR